MLLSSLIIRKKINCQVFLDEFYCFEIIRVSSVSFIVCCVPEFAQSLQEMGTCLLEKTSLNDDEESGEWVNIS